MWERLIPLDTGRANATNIKKLHFYKDKGRTVYSGT